MADEKVENQDPDEKELRAELEADGEVLDNEGKPLSWSHPKRIRQIYKEAKAGRQATAALRDLGVKPSDIPNVKASLARLAELEEERETYLASQRADETTEDEDEEAKADKQKIARIKKQLKALGVRFDEPADEEQEAAKASEAAVQSATGRVREVVLEMLEDAGYDLETMDSADRSDLLEEFDMKVGQRIKRTEGAREAILGGSLRPVRKIMETLLEGRSLPAKPGETPKPSGLKNLPPRLSRSSTPTKVSATKPTGPPPKSTREATEQMVEELRAQNKARRTGEG